MTSERRIDRDFEATLAEIRADFRAAGNSMIRWNVASTIVAMLATFLILR